MVVIKLVSIVSAFLAAILGFIAAAYWYRASKVQIEPSWGRTEPAEADASHAGWTMGIMQAYNASADLNKAAALWTAASVGLGALSTLLGIRT